MNAPPAFIDGQTVKIADTAQSLYIGALGVIVGPPKWIGSWSYRISLVGALAHKPEMRFWQEELESIQ